MRSDVSARPLIHIAEPKLAFRFGQTVEYPRDGLYLFGPVDAEDQPRPIRYGVIGTRQSVRRFREWADEVSGFIDVPPPRPRAKAIEPHHVPFPGFSEAFHSLWRKVPVRVIDTIDETELRDRMRIYNRHEAVKTAVDMFVERLIDHRKRDEDPPAFWYVVIPEFVHKFGRPESTIARADGLPGKVSMTESRAARLATEPTLFGEDEREAEIFKYAKHFRRQLKARLLEHEIVTQIVRETTLTPHEFVKANGMLQRPVEDAATIAWKLSAGSYYKSGGRPWQLAGIRPGVCYVGLVYKKQPGDDPRFACCAAQMFLSDGDGIVFRGALGPWFNPDTKQFHLDRAAACRLATMVIEEYKLTHPGPPAELFIHARASFADDEWAGFDDACAGMATNVVGVQISDAWDRLKLFRPGSYPVIRGTAFKVTDRQAFLWTSGYVPRLDTYMGPDTPNPLDVSIRRGDAELETVLSDVLALGKINFNSCLYNDRSPVTINFADAIGDILVSAPPPKKEPRLPFKYYI